MHGKREYSRNPRIFLINLCWKKVMNKNERVINNEEWKLDESAMISGIESASPLLNPHLCLKPSFSTYMIADHTTRDKCPI